MLPLPKKRPAFVDDGGGGGFWICDAVGARDWRIEYVRCIVSVILGTVVDSMNGVWCEMFQLAGCDLRNVLRRNGGPGCCS